MQEIQQQISENVINYIKKQETDKALEEITFWALSMWSSDIHYEFFEDYVVVRFRIDGILRDIFTLNLLEYKLITERLKYASNLKLNIIDIPQDWKYELHSNEKSLDIRVSTLPVWWKENIVCRILDNTSNIVDFEELWFFWTTKRILNKSIKKRDGMILVTWPTWSWKTTTLYSILSKLNSREKKIITLEDPIEYRLDWIIQSEVDEKKGFTFKTGLRSLLRQDPDIIMVWEIRDSDTLETSVQASLTWHLVLSTLHTKSAAETLNRILNMWLQPYILASSLNTIIAQRLVRKVCQDCKVLKEKTPNDINIIETFFKELGLNKNTVKNTKLYEGSWCKKCNNTGYKWRIGIYEIIHLNSQLRWLIREGASSLEILKQARDVDFVTMKEDGFLKAIRWFTTIDEVLRVI